MATRYHGTDDRCPYDLASSRMGECPRFEPRVLVARADEPFVGCAHTRCAIAARGPDGGAERTFYARCVLRTADIEAESAFVMPLD